jgi:hypothetical protein
MTRRLGVCHAVLAGTLIASAINLHAQFIVVSGDSLTRASRPPRTGPA